MRSAAADCGVFHNIPRLINQESVSSLEDTTSWTSVANVHQMIEGLFMKGIDIR